MGKEDKAQIKQNANKIRAKLVKECNFIKSIFSVLSVPERMKEWHDETDDYVYVKSKQQTENQDEDESTNKRAQSIVELQRRLEKIKQANNFSIKNKLKKKSLTTKLNQKAKSLERGQKNKKNKKGKDADAEPGVELVDTKDIKDVKPKINQAKPVFNSEGKLVFSKFDFTGMGQKGKKNKLEKDPKKLLEDLKKQQETVKSLKESGEIDKAAELRDKIAWKNALAKAEGLKVKDDPNLLKKSMKKMESKKKKSKKSWEERIQNVEHKKQELQKKRKENISKKNKEKKAKKIKTSTKRGRIVV